MYRLARCYRDGDGTKQDFALSLKWYKAAAATGDKDSMYHVGQHYVSGWGVPIDEEEAREWFQKAADKGDSDAQRAIDMMNCGIFVDFPWPGVR